jgi:adenylate cyclase
MPEERVQRRLAAIFVADAVGYSRLMELDEAGTLSALKTLMDSLFLPRVAEHRGRVVKTTGDGILAEFGSVVDAVRCAVTVQQAINERNIHVVPDKRLLFRIGINLGDVVIDGADLYGDCVNIAAPPERQSPR